MSTIQRIRQGAKALDDLADAIRNPQNQGAVGNAIGQAGRRFCDAFSAGEALRDGDVPTAQLPGVGLARATATLVCTPYWDDNNYDAPVIVPPFTGGQCEGTIYQFVITADPATPGGLGAVNSNAKTRGPITSWRVAVEGTRYKGYVTSRGNITAQSCGVGAGTLQPLQERQAFDVLNRGQINAQFSILGVCDNGPDNCGDPAGDLGPGLNPAPSPGPFPSGEEPSIGPDGQPFFFVPPIETPFGDVDVPDDFFGGDPNPGAGDGLPGLGDAVGAEAGDVGAGDGENIDFGEPPEGRVWVGCIVETTADSRIGNIVGTGPGQTVWPTVRGNLSLNYGSRKGSNIRINSRFTEAYRPVTSLVVTGAYLQMQPFSNGKVFPVSALKCPENPCGDD